MSFAKIIRKESTITVIGLSIIGWLWVESTFFTEPYVASAPVHPVGTPVEFEIRQPGEAHIITIGRSGSGPMRHRRRSRNSQRLIWQLYGPTGNLVLADNDAVAQATRLVHFTPALSGAYTLKVNWDNSGFFKRHGAGFVTILVERDQRSFMMRWFGWLW
jgi:hypothetical protein